MTVIAWDGKIIAADRMATHVGMQKPITKLFRYENTVYAIEGTYDQGLLLMQWHENGAKSDEYPEFQKNKPDDGFDWTRLIVVTKNEIGFYDQLPVKHVVENNFLAWGAGRAYAMATMHLGYDAKKAIEVASYYDICCGNGIDYYCIKDL